MSFLNSGAKQQVKNMLRRLDDGQFRHLVADLYARQGATVSFETHSNRIDFVLEDPYDFTDDIFGTVAVNCIVLNREISFVDIRNVLSSDLPELFDGFYLCTNAENTLDSYGRSQLRSSGYEDEWFTFKNYSTICSLLESYDNDYLAYLYYEVSPSDYEGGIRDEGYIEDRFNALGIVVSEYAITKLSDSAEPLRDINMVEKFVLSETVGSGLIRNHINPIFDQNDYIQVAVQNGRPSESEATSNIFKQ